MFERRCGGVFNTGLWVGVLAAAQACLEEPGSDVESDDGSVSDTTPLFFSSLRSEPDKNQDPPNRRPVRSDSWPGSVTIFGLETFELDLSDYFSDPDDDDDLTYTIFEKQHLGIGVDSEGLMYNSKISAGIIRFTAKNRPSMTRIGVKATDGSSDCPTSDGGMMECRATGYLMVYVREKPTFSESDYVNVSVSPYDIGVEGINRVHQGGSAQGCVPFSFKLDKPVSGRFAYEYRIVPVPASTVVYGNKGAPASFFADGTTGRWIKAGFQHRMNVGRKSVEQTRGGFCVQLKGVTAHSNTGALTYTDHCPKGEFRHFYVEMRIPEYWTKLLGVRMAPGQPKRSIMNLECQ
ncbi:MAG: hypothetical protein F4135_03365 [Acidimicrobiia bacterium]|nr:hypothetical protein [Acidimicrobiia bacterium]